MANDSSSRRAPEGEFDVCSLDVFPRLERGLNGREVTAVGDNRHALLMNPIRDGHRRPLRILSGQRCNPRVGGSRPATEEYNKDETVFLQANESVWFGFDA